CGAPCDDGYICNGSGVCELTCQNGLTDCNGECVNLLTDSRYCSSDDNCGSPCDDGEKCVNGNCEISCYGDLVECSNMCVDTSTDPMHCGGCDNECSDNNAYPVCVESECMAVCFDGYGDCYEGDGCESPITTSLHCGSCDRSCELSQDCTLDLECETCVVTVSSMSSPPGPIPSGLKTECLSTPCPIVQCGQVAFWFFSYNDNREALNIVGYDTSGNIVSGPTNKSGTRYIDYIVDFPADEYVKVYGQTDSVTVPYTNFRLP
ncbi:MAG: hypothetical protein JXR95_09500, partial [Deltaproteobacteria bacterium]|nr:hypothetical protein [Deltaproteobacteria bacterium]